MGGSRGFPNGLDAPLQSVVRVVIGALLDK